MTFPTKVEVAWASAHVSRKITLPRGLKPTLPGLLSETSTIGHWSYSSKNPGGLGADPQNVHPQILLKSQFSTAQIEGPFHSYWAGIPRGVSPLAIVGTVTDGVIAEASATNDGPFNSVGPLNGFRSNPQQVRGIMLNKTITGESLTARSHAGKTVSGGYSSNHPGGAQFVLGDRSVRFISNSIDPNSLINLMRRSDGQTIVEY